MSKILEPTIFEISQPGRVGVQLPACDVPEKPASELLPGVALRSELPMPELAEPDVVRHFVRISNLNYNVDKGFYPLGSCTMKYNPKVNDQAVGLPGFARVHPFQPEDTLQGALEVLYNMQSDLANILGMDAVSLQPAAGAHGELLGLMLIRAYHVHNGDGETRKKVLVPTAAHGTNPASAARCGYSVVDVNTDERGLTDMAHLKEQAREKCGAGGGLHAHQPEHRGAVRGGYP
ncbi:MAG: hypothetical protein QM758_22040 [Armatimonas sp.]